MNPYARDVVVFQYQERQADKAVTIITGDV